MYAPQELAASLVGAATLASSVPSMSCYPVQAGTVQTESSSPGSGWGNGGSCLQHSFQPWLTRVRARPCCPLQRMRPLNCLQLQTAQAGPQPWLPLGTEPKPLQKVRGNAIQPSLQGLRGSLGPLGPFLVCPKDHPDSCVPALVEHLLLRLCSG